MVAPEPLKFVEIKCCINGFVRERDEVKGWERERAKDKHAGLYEMY